LTARDVRSLPVPVTALDIVEAQMTLRHRQLRSRLLLILLLSLVCGPPLSGAQATVSQESGEAEVHLQRATEAMAGLNSFHFALTTVEGTTQFMEQFELSGLEGDVERPDRFKATITAKAAIIELSVEAVGIGNQVWITDPLSSEKRWIVLNISEMTGTDRPITDLINPDRILLEAVNLIEPPMVAGEEEIDGTKTTRIDGVVDVSRLQQAATPVASDAASDAAAELLPISIWIGDEGFIRRLEIAGALTDAESPDVVRRLDLSGFNQDVAIEAPE